MSANLNTKLNTDDAIKEISKLVNSPFVLEDKIVKIDEFEYDFNTKPKHLKLIELQYEWKDQFSITNPEEFFYAILKQFDPIIQGFENTEYYSLFEIKIKEEHINKYEVRYLLDIHLDKSNNTVATRRRVSIVYSEHRHGLGT